MEVVHYFDASALLVMLFNQEKADTVLNIWDSSAIRISSLLTYFECVTVNHRYCLSLPKVAREAWQHQAKKWIEQALQSIALHEINQTVLQRLKNEVALGNSRTLDAIHLSTALLFHDLGAQVHLVSCDDRMRKKATEFGLAILPD